MAKGARDTSQRRLVLADWDNTLSEGFAQIRWVEFLASHNLFESVSAVRELVAEFSNNALEYEDFCEKMGKAYAAGLVGHSHAEISQAARQFVECDRGVFPFIPALWQLFEAENLEVIVISGAPAEILHQQAEVIGFEVGGALQPGIKEGRYTGEVLQNIGLHKHKLATVLNIASNSSVVIALGDAPSDLPLLHAASVPCVVVGSQTRCSPFVRGIVPLDPAKDPTVLVEQLRCALVVSEAEN